MALLYAGFQSVGAWLGRHVGCGIGAFSTVRRSGHRPFGRAAGAVRFVGGYCASAYVLRADSNTGSIATRSYPRRMLVDLVDPSHELCPSLALFEMASGFGLDLIFLVSLASTRISFWSYHHR